MKSKEEHLEKILEYLNAHQVAMDWYYNEKLYEHEYKAQIGAFDKYNPAEIINELQDYIKKYNLNG